MSILSDRWIREQALAHAMIEPFVEAQRADGCISYGLSSYGYDARRARHLPRQIDLCAVRDHRERHPARARLGGACDARILEHHAAAGESLRQRRRVPVSIPTGQ